MSYPSFLAELTIGWAMSHPLPTFTTIGVLGTGAVLAIANAVMRREDMPLSMADQATLDTITAIERPAELAPHRGRHVPRHARPRPPVPAPALVAGRAATWTLAALTDRLHAAQAAPLALPAPTNVPGRPEGRDTAISTAAASVPHTHDAAENPAGPAGDPTESIWPHDTGWYSAAAIEAAVTAGEARR